MKPVISVKASFIVFFILIMGSCCLFGCNSIFGDTDTQQTTDTNIGGHETQTECYTDLDKCGHNWSEINRTESTCSKAGAVNYACDLCENQMSEMLEKKEHTAKTIEGKQPTCKKSGYGSYRQCTVCGYVIEDAEYLAPTGNHKEIIIEGRPATCKKDGKTDGIKCSVCGEIIKKQEVIAAGHEWEIVPRIDPTCTHPGYEENKKCINCGELYKDITEIPPEHTDLKVLDGYDATCTIGGLSDSQYCAACNQILVYGKETQPLGHDYQTKPGCHATCLSNGFSDGVECSRCGDVRISREIEYATGHGFENGICGSCGIEVTKCLELVLFEDGLSGDKKYLVSGFADGFGYGISELIVPDMTQDGHQIIGIADTAFQGNTTIERVVLSENIVFVGSKAFDQCPNLKIAECYDLSQTLNWNKDWCGNSNIRVKAVSNKGENYYDIYIDAIGFLYAGLNNCKYSNEYFIYEGDIDCLEDNGFAFYSYYELMQSGMDCYSYMRKEYPDHQTEAESWYADGYVYITNYLGTATNAKMSSSYEAWISSVDDISIPVFPPELLPYTSLYMDADGGIYMELSIDGNLNGALTETLLNEPLGDARCEHLVYTYKFDSKGKLEALSYIAEITNDAEHGIQDKRVIVSVSAFGEIGTLESVNPIPKDILWLDISAVNCLDNGEQHIETVVQAVNPSCYRQGFTEYSYCSDCLCVIREVSQIDAVHNYVDGVCSVCGCNYNQ